MDFPSSVTNEAYLKLKCSSCGNHLSHFPIYISDKKQNVCGRTDCLAPLEIDKCAQNEIYETLAQFVEFPCCYKDKGCDKKITPNDIPNHEMICDFRLIQCPVRRSTGCTWEGELPKCSLHCEDKHFDLLVKNGEFTLDLSKTYECENLIEYKSKLYLIGQKFFTINKLMEFAVYNHEYEIDPKQVSCKINFSTDTRSLTITYNTTSFNDKKIIDIILDSLNFNEFPQIHCKVSFEEKITQIEAPPKNVIDEVMLNSLKCDGCQEYALPPIYQDTNATKITRCYNCQDYVPGTLANQHQFNIFQPSKLQNKSRNNVVPETVNSVLNRISSELNYPCKYRKSGCTLIVKAFAMTVHQTVCPFGNQNCPVAEFTNCQWNGIGRDIPSHIQEVHRNIIINSSIKESLQTFVPQISKSTSFGSGRSVVFGTSSAISISDNNTSENIAQLKCYLIQFADNFFRLNVAQADQYFIWVVQKIGPDHDKYMFELEVEDVNNPRNSLITRQPCTTLKKKDELLKIHNNCYFNKNQISRLLVNDYITFRVQVYTS